MTLIKKISYLVTFVLMLIGIAAYLLIRIELSYSSYSSYQEVLESAPLDENSWLPNWLPKSATFIQESHDIDTNESWFVFYFEGYSDFYKISCSSVEKANVVFPRKRIKYIIPEFVYDIQEQLKTNSSLLFFTCNGINNGYLAADLQHNIAYGWSLAH